MVEVLVGICLLSHAEVLLGRCAGSAKSLAKKRGDSVERHVRGRQVTYWRLRNSRSRYRSQCVDVGQWWLPFALPSWRFATAMRGASSVLPLLSQVTQRSCRTVIDRISTQQLGRDKACLMSQVFAQGTSKAARLTRRADHPRDPCAHVVNSGRRRAESAGQTL